jgi:predicted ester cyclase
MYSHKIAAIRPAAPRGPHPRVLRQFEFTPAAERNTMPTVDNKQVVQEFLRAEDAGDLAAMADLLDPSFVMHQLVPPPGRDVAVDEFREFLAEQARTAADLRHVIRLLVAEGEFVATFVSVTGTHLADWCGIPAAGEAFSTPEMHLIRIVDGRLVEMWALVDALGLMMQLGVFPGAAGADV